MSEDERHPIGEWLRATVDDEANKTEPLLDSDNEKHCFPHYFIVDRHRRTISCKRCGGLFDPIAAFQYMASNWVRYAQNLAALRGEIDMLTARRDELKSEVRSLRSKERRSVQNPHVWQPERPGSVLEICTNCGVFKRARLRLECRAKAVAQ